MYDRLVKIKEVLSEDFEDENFMLEDDDDFQMVEIPYLFNITLLKGDDLCISFFSNVAPDTAAVYVKMIYDAGVYDFVILENMYPKYSADGKFEDMLFGTEADQEYAKVVYNKTKQQELLAMSAVTYGPKQ